MDNLQSKLLDRDVTTIDRVFIDDVLNVFQNFRWRTVFQTFTRLTEDVWSFVVENAGGLCTKKVNLSIVIPIMYMYVLAYKYWLSFVPEECFSQYTSVHPFLL